jgi:hypothetical protein
VAPDLVTQFARVAGPRNDDGRSIEVADAPDGEAEPAELFELRLGRRRPRHLIQYLAALRALHRDVVELIGGRLDPDLEAQFLGLLAQPDAAAADPAEVVGPQPEQRAIVDHAAGLAAHGRIDDLAGREAPYVTGQGVLHQGFSIRTQDLEFPKRRQVDHRDALAARPVFLDRPIVRVTVGQPIAPVLGETTGHFRGARMERRLADRLGFAVGCHSVGHRFGDAVPGRADPDVDAG